MTMMLIILLSVVIIAGVIFFGYKYYKNSTAASVGDDAAEAAEFIGYKKPVPKDKNLNIKNRLEYSWKFLYDISNKVLNYFSLEDQQEVHDTGRMLLEKGMKYEHVIDLAISTQTSQVSEVSQKKSSNQINM